MTKGQLSVHKTNKQLLLMKEDVSENVIVTAKTNCDMLFPCTEDLTIADFLLSTKVHNQYHSPNSMLTHRFLKIGCIESILPS